MLAHQAADLLVVHKFDELGAFHPKCFGNEPADWRIPVGTTPTTFDTTLGPYLGTASKAVGRRLVKAKAAKGKDDHVW